MHSGFTLVSFKDEVTRNIILETGVIQFDRKPVILRPWSEDMDTTRMVKSIPVWVRLNGLGLQYWGKKNLSALVSTIGKPSMADKLPTKCTACDMLGHSISNCNKGKPIVWKKKQQGDKLTAVEHDVESKGISTEKVSGATESEKSEIHASNVAKLGGYSKVERGITSEGTGVVENATIHTRNEQWVTPKRKGAKSVIRPQQEAITNNDYEALEDAEEASFRWGAFSDHSYCLVKHIKAGNRGTKPFRFCNHWVFKEDFRENVLTTWKKHMVTDLQSLHHQLFRVKHILKNCYVKKNEDIIGQYNDARDKFMEAQEALAINPKCPTTVITENYFHAIIKKRRAENQVCSFTVNGVVVDEYDKVVEHFLNHFRNFMGRQSSTSRRLDEDCLEFGNKLTIEHQANLIRPFSKKDVKEALFGIHSSKILGPDGFGAGFFKELWNDIGDDFSCAVLGFFQTGKLPQELSATSISLIPKIDNPQGAFDYRPIACCTTTYKCISKMICTRLSEVLPELIHENQGGFVKKRLLSHNVLILHDLLKGLVNLRSADDLIIFCKGNDKSVKMVKDAFQRFSEATGLIGNKAKSTYLGVNLRPTKWRSADCGIILDKLHKNLHTWASRNLPFAGRAQLIHSILLGIRNYWMGLFLLPQKITTAIDKCVRDFLWGSKGNKSKFHIPSWEKFCLPKNSGDLGFKKGKVWNIALMEKYIWAISSKQDNLWVRWIDAIYLRGLSFWTVEFKQDASWYFKKILRLHSTINESNVIAAVKRGKLSAKLFYLSYIQAHKVDYARNIWNRMVHPKHRFVGWQIVNNQLLTRDNLSRFLSISSPLCRYLCRKMSRTERLLVPSLLSKLDL
uniref:Reverse transcriptase zinc-binding domain-containing protein n=1 Tax=Cannabis sativa TaxID=3483 RepID=A0A803NL01_CANSA